MADNPTDLNKLSAVMQKNLVYTSAQFDLSRDLAQQSQKVAKATNKSIDRVADNLDHIVQKVNTVSDNATKGKSIEGNFKEWIKDFGKKAAENQTEVFTTSGKLIKKGERGFELDQSAYNKRTQDALQKFEQNQKELADQMSEGLLSQGIKMLGTTLVSGVKKVGNAFASFADGDVFSGIGGDLSELFGSAMGSKFKDMFKKLQAVVSIPLKLIKAPLKLLSKGLMGMKNLLMGGGIMGKLKLAALVIGFFAAFKLVKKLVDNFKELGLDKVLQSIKEVMQNAWYATVDGFDRLLLWFAGEDSDRGQKISRRIALRDIDRAETLLARQGITAPKKKEEETDEDFEKRNEMYTAQLMGTLPKGYNRGEMQDILDKRLNVDMEKINDKVDRGRQDIANSEGAITTGEIVVNKATDQATVEIIIDKTALANPEDSDLAANLVPKEVEVSSKKTSFDFDEDGKVSFGERFLGDLMMGGMSASYSGQMAPVMSQLNEQALKVDRTKEEIGDAGIGLTERELRKQAEDSAVQEYYRLRKEADASGLGDIMDMSEMAFVKGGERIRDNSYWLGDGPQDRKDILELMESLKSNDNSVEELIAKFQEYRDEIDKRDERTATNNNVSTISSTGGNVTNLSTGNPNATNQHNISQIMGTHNGI
jgi:3-methyladenine DNA glycosylase Tag